MAKKPKVARCFPEGEVPLISCEGTAYEAGVQLGYSWAEALKLMSQDWEFGTRAWWMEKPYRKLIDRCAPHLPDLFRGMAKGARVPENRVSHPVAMADPAGGCTSFAIQPKVCNSSLPEHATTQ